METAAVIVGLLALYVGLPVAILTIRDRIFDRERYTPEQLAEFERRRVRRILAPDWAFYQQRLERPVPDSLRRLFDKQPTASRGFFDEEDLLFSYQLAPIDESALLDTRHEFRLEVVPFMEGQDDGEGDILFLRPGRTEPNVVYIAYGAKKGDGHFEVISSSIDEFVAKLSILN